MARQMELTTLQARMAQASAAAQAIGENSPGWYVPMPPAMASPGDVLSAFHPHGQTVNVPGIGTFQFTNETVTADNAQSQLAFLRSLASSKQRR